MKNDFAAIFRRVVPKALIAIACALVMLSSEIYGLPVTVGPEPQEVSNGPAARIQGDLSTGSRVRLRGTLHPLARAKNDTGVVSSTTVLHGISIIFKRSDVQQADLKALMKAQRDSASPLYHQWLRPAQFAARFGMAQADLEKVSDWLQKQGFSIDRVSTSRDRIFFSGTVAQVNSAFSTSLHYFTVDGEKHFAPSTEVSVPAALSSVVQNVGNLDSFRPKGMHHLPEKSATAAKPDYTSGVSGNTFVAPGDIATIYNVVPAYHAGINGDGQSIAIVGQSDVYLSDIENFQTASGFATPKDPVKVLVPTTGNAGNYHSGGDEGESDLDLEWSSSIAPNATIYFVYTGDGGNAGVFDSIVYAIETRIAPIISVSYGACEIAIGSPANVQSLEDAFQQAATQGQTLLAASGDTGGAECFRDTGLSNSDRAALSISYPGSSPFFTGVGGTQFNEGSGSYWNSTPGTDIVSSALSYIPEVAWNEDVVTGQIASTGGGPSILFTKPDWQTGVPGIPADGVRDSPDIALDSAAIHDALLFCTSDTAFWQTGQQASCNSGFRDSSTTALTSGGGTSFATPIFAGMLALINQQQNSTGQGPINSKLYTLASSPATYASAFHDITGGDNMCDTPSASYCPNGPTGYSATTGYDMTTGLGSVDFANLMTSWGSPTLAGSRTTLTLITAQPTTAAPVQITVKVAAADGTTVPTGTVTMVVDGTTDPTPLTLDNGAVTYNAIITGSGAHIVVAIYSGDSTFAASTSTLTVSTLFQTTTNIDVSPMIPILGATTTITSRVEPTSGFNLPTGTVVVSIDGSPVQYPVALVKGTSTYTTVFSKAGKHTISSSYSGDTNFEASTGTVTVNAVTGTSTTVIANSGAPLVGQGDNITVNVAAASGSAIPTGSLRVVVNGTVLTPAPVLGASGSVTFPVSFASIGTQTVAVSYPGTSEFGASSGSVSVQVAPAASVTTVTAATTAPLLKQDDLFTINVAAASGGMVADGFVTVTVDGTAVANPLPLTNGVATYTTSFTTEGAHTVSAAYTGDADAVGSTGAITVKVPSPSFTLTSTPLTTPQNGVGTSTITITPASGYAGTIRFAVSASSMNNTCFSLPDITVDSSGPATALLKVTTSCKTATTTAALDKPKSPANSGRFLGGSSVALAGVLLGFIGRKPKWRQSMLIVFAILGMTGMAIGCGGSSHRTAKGSYTLTVTGTDTSAQSVKSTVTVNVTVD